MKTCLLPLTVLCCITLATEVCAQSTVVTYQGRVQSGEEDFTGNGQFKFALVTVTNNNRTAAATATVTSGFVTSIAVNAGGNGYVSPPAVTISGGGGSGATATASIGGGSVTGIIVNNPGSGYSTAPTVTVAPPPEALTYTTYWSNDGTSVNGSEPSAAVSTSVTDGLFTIRLGDTTLANMTALPAAVFQRPNLHARLWFNDGVSGFAVLHPTQPLTAAPYAFIAGSASNLLGTLSSAQLNGTYSSPVTLNNVANSFTGNGAGLTTLNASQLSAGTVLDARLSANVSLLGQTIEGTEITDGTIGPADVNLTSFNTAFWRVTGNAGTTAGTHFLGTTDNQPVEIKVNGLRALRLEPNATSPNVLGGFSGNRVGVGFGGSTIGGGGNAFNTNTVYADFATIAGGSANDIGTNADYSAVSGGNNNNIAADSQRSTIAGGDSNDIETNSTYSAIGGGLNNTIGPNATRGTIAGGSQNLIATNSGNGAIGGGSFNQILSGSTFGTISGGSDNRVGTSSTYVAIGGGFGNRIAADSSYSTIAGGYLNDIGTNADYGAIGGGNDNTIGANSVHSLIAGGNLNDIGANSGYSTIGGGYHGVIGTNSDYSTIAGGNDNTIAANSRNSLIAGGGFNDIGANSSYSTIGGGIANTINTFRSIIAGGEQNDIGTSSSHSVVGGGFNNNIGTNSRSGTIGGGTNNNIAPNSWNTTIGGGFANNIGTNCPSSSIAGGQENIIMSETDTATIAGGLRNEIGINSRSSTIGGGNNNNIAANAEFATIPGGANNEANGSYSFAAGRRAKATQVGTFVWADSQAADFSGGLPDSVSFRCQGGVRFTSGSGAANQTVQWLPGFNLWSFSSDRNLKEGLTAVDTQEVLDKVSRLPMNEWSFKGHSQRHIGPIAQDFHALFPLNENDTMIDSGDLHGVSLAAIQGLNQKLQKELHVRDEEIGELKQTVSELKRLVRQLADEQSGNPK